MVSDLIGNPNCWFSHAQAQLVYSITYRVGRVDEFPGFAELYKALLHVVEWPLHQTFLLLKVGQQVVPQGLLKVKHSQKWMSCNEKKIGVRGFRPGLTQTGLCSYRRRLEAWNFRFRKKRNCDIYVAKTKALISCAVTAQLICAFVFP